MSTIVDYVDMLRVMMMSGIDDLIICPRCLKPMGEEIDAMVCQHCGYDEREEECLE